MILVLGDLTWRVGWILGFSCPYLIFFKTNTQLCRIVFSLKWGALFIFILQMSQINTVYVTPKNHPNTYIQ